MSTSARPINHQLADFNSSLINVDLVITEATATLINGTLNLSWTTANQGTDPADGQGSFPLWLDSFFLSDDANFDPGVDQFITSSFITEPLAGGSSYGLSRQFGFFSGTEGKYLIVVTDYGDSQPETNENNNVFAALITSDIPDVDLVVSDLVAPSVAVVNSEIEISWTVLNQGTEAASANWTDQIYFSTDATFDVSDRLLDSESISTQTPLEAGNNYTINRNVSLDSFAIGNASSGYLLVVADGENFQPESDEDNNVRAVPINLTVPDVDLVISETTITPSTVGLGTTIDISWTVLNQGTETASGNWADFVYFSNNDTYDGPFGDDFYLTQAGNDNSPLAAGESYTINRSVTLNNSAVGYLIFVTDIANDQAETDNDNNVLAVPINLSTPDVDLVVSEATATLDGGGISLSWTTSNLGTDTAFGLAGWFDSFFLSEDATYDPGDEFITSSFITEPLAGGSSYSLSRDLNASPLPNQRYLLVVTDFTDEQVETDETNNVFAIPLPILGQTFYGGTGADEFVGTSGDDTFLGFQGRDTLTGGEGSDRFVYNSIVDAGDRITDFEVNVDQIVLTGVLQSIGYTGFAPIADQYIRFSSVNNTTFIQIDPDGSGVGRARNLINVGDIAIADLNNSANFEF